MKIGKKGIVFDTADLGAESTFWAGLLGGTVEATDDWHTLVTEDDWYLAFQLAPDHVPPEWPNGTLQQIHLDLWVDDPETAHAEVMALGATVLKEVEDLGEPDVFQVYADPAGHPFCLCWSK
ncbi:VOC family protein [Haloglycomyces albus]|uniref:VOC family protein n=1 Tax=Haloglycomyces albus TaxID=526067 RepID=UPI0004A467B7|nr:VOC family protein [Haloglycomyces albus]